jgi:hypothetical protein
MDQKLQTMYKAAHAYHTRHDPPQDTPDYWGWAVADLAAVSCQHNNDPFIIGLLQAVYAELERGYAHLLAEKESA